MRLRFHILLIIYYILSVQAYTQIKIHKNISIEEGLIQSQVTCIYKDSNDYMWFGTLGGLSRWDGISFVNYNLQDGLSSPLVSAIVEGQHKELYICTNGGGVSILRKEKFDTLTTEDGLADNHVYTALISRTGRIYFGTAAGISIYANYKFYTFDESKGLSNNRVTSIYESTDGTIFFCTANGVTTIKDGNIDTITTRNGLTGNMITCIREGQDGTLYFGTWGNGITIYKNGMYYPLKKEQGLSDNIVFTITSGNDNKMYFGTWGGGVNIFKNGKLEQISSAQGLGNDVVMSIYEDENGTVYFGTDGGGVSIYCEGKFETWNTNSGLPEMSVRAIYKDRKGDIYIGTDGSGVSILSHGKFIHLNEIHGLSNNNIRCFYEIGNGEILVGTFGGGVSVIKNKKIIKNSMFKQLYNHRIKTIYQDLNGNLLIGTYNEGVYFYRDGRFLHNINMSKELSSNFINTIFQDSDSTYYFGTWEGVNILKNNNISFLNTKNGLINNYVNVIYKDKRGNIYFGTDGGLNILNNRNIKAITTRDGLSDNTILGIIEDNYGNIYLSTNRGVNILKFTGGSFSIRTIRNSDGLASDENNQGAVYKDDSGCLWFGTSKGVTRYSPDADLPSYLPPTVHIARVRIFERDIDLSYPNNTNLHYNDNYIKFDFIGINLPSTDKVVYKYRLSGIDEDWVQTNLRFVQYTNLDDGSYTFELMAKNEWGIWSKPKTLSFIISPPFWKTWWFRLLLAAVLMSLLWFIYIMRVRKIIEIERLRLRIASDLHDDIGATLTHISVNSEIIKHSDEKEKIKEAAGRIGFLSRDVIQTMSDIVWSIDSRNDTVEDMILRMQDFAYHLLTPKDIKFKFSYEGLNLSKKMNIDMRQNIYLIFKEAVNNAAKHSSADLVEVKLINHKDYFLMTIKDNGSGSSGTNFKGNGLRNIKMRIIRITGKVEFVNGSGFEIKIKTQPI